MNSVSSLEGLGAGVLSTILGTAVANQFMHPNALGYQAETNTILQWSVSDAAGTDEQTDWKTSPAPLPWPDFLTPSVIARAMLPPQTTAGPAVFDAARDTWLSDPLDARAGQQVEIEVHNAAPGSEVSISIASKVRPIGIVPIGDDGSGTSAVTIPRGVIAGSHRLTALGFDIDGNPALASQSIDVARAYPLWLTPLALLTLLLFLLAGWWARIDRRRRRRLDAGSTAQL
jgi:hypothetical protein